MREGSLKIERNDKSIRFYERNGYAVLLCNFMPIKGKLVEALEAKDYEVERVVQFKSVDMGIVIMRESVEEILNFIANSEVL